MLLGLTAAIYVMEVEPGLEAIVGDFEGLAKLVLNDGRPGLDCVPVSSLESRSSRACVEANQKVNLPPSCICLAPLALVMVASAAPEAESGWEKLG